MQPFATVGINAIVEEVTWVMAVSGLVQCRLCGKS